MGCKTSTMKAITFGSLLILFAAISMVSSQFENVPADLINAIWPRSRNEYVNTESVTPCSPPENPNPLFLYPDFPECIGKKCPICEPILISTKSNLPLPTKPPRLKPLGKPRPFPNVAIIPDLNKPQVQPRPVTYTIPALGPIPTAYNTPSVQPVQQYVVTAHDPTLNIVTGAGCPSQSLSTYIAQPYQCPYTPAQEVPLHVILKILNSINDCQKPLECHTSVSELLLRITLLQERLRGLAIIESRLKVQTQLLAQITLKIADVKNLGNPGPIGDRGLRGPQGLRGNRGPSGTCKRIGMLKDTTGPPGSDGPTGARGSPGEKVCDCDGDPGSPGSPGFTIHGHPGPKGTKGPKGPRGKDVNPIDL